MLRKTICAAVVAFGVAGAAQAGDFSGQYAGVAVTHDSIGGAGGGEGFGFSGAGASAFVGYNFPLSDKLFGGVEANADLNTADVGDVVEAKWGWGASARVGLKLSEGTAAYGRVGWQRSKVEALGDSSWGDGVRLGGGLEAKVAGSAALRVEYNHVNYEDDLVNNQAVVGLVFSF